MCRHTHYSIANLHLLCRETRCRHIKIEAESGFKHCFNKILACLSTYENVQVKIYTKVPTIMTEI